MPAISKYPLLYQLNLRVFLNEISRNLGRSATLDDFPDVELERLKALGFEWIWMLSVWATGEAARRVSLVHKGWRKEFEETLPDLKEEDIGGSGFAVLDYRVHPNLGGDAALERLHARMKMCGMKLMLDFVPNHFAPDHLWVHLHPQYFVQGTEDDIAETPQNFIKVSTHVGETVMAHGRDPYFDGWPDTVQLDYSHPQLVEAMKNELLRISGQCDGVRCDMAMLVLPEVFHRTWGRRALSFWPEAIAAVRKSNPEFLFMAEVYWDMEWEMLQQGFDYAYDKRLYDRLHTGDAKSVHGHLLADIEYQRKLVRFLENHDEQRAAQAFEFAKHQAAAVITFLSPGLRFFHQGQMEGRRKRISPHLIRAPLEAEDKVIHHFYQKIMELLRKPIFRNGKWILASCTPAWDGNLSHENFIAFNWHDQIEGSWLIAVNYAPQSSQCYVKFPQDFSGRTLIFIDSMSNAEYRREENAITAQGLYLDLSAWGFHVFEIKIEQ